MTAPWSFPWTDTSTPGPAIGDGRPFTSAEWALYLWQTLAHGNANAGVLKGAWNELAVTVGGANLLNVNTGVGMAAGRLAFYDAVSTLAPASAGAGTTRKDAVILEADFDNSGVGQNKCRVTYKQGTAGAYPAMTQNLATVYQVLLYYYIIDDAGAITSLSDQRTFFRDDTVPDLFLGMQVEFTGALGGSDGHRPVIGGVANEQWHLANGETVNGVVTKDTRDRVSIGAGSAYAVGATGGAATHQHAAGSYLDSVHRHPASTIAIADHAAYYNPVAHGGIAGYDAPFSPAGRLESYNLTQTHSVSGHTDWDGGRAVTGTSASGSSLPPYIAVYKVVYVGT